MSNGKPPEIENNVMKIDSMPNDSKKVEATLNDITRLTDELRADLKNHKAFSTLTICTYVNILGHAGHKSALASPSMKLEDFQQQ